MEFREYASRETAAVVSRLLTAQAEAQIRLAKEALEHAAKALDGRITHVASSDDVRDLVQRLEAAAGIAIQRVQQEAQKAVDAAREETAAAERQTAEAQSLITSLRAENAQLADRASTAEADLDATIEAHRQIELELRELRTQLDGARAEITRLEGGLEAAAAQRTTLSEELAGAREHVARLEGALAAAQAAAAEESDARTTLQAELDAARSRLATLEESRATLRAELEGAQAAWKAADAELETARAGFVALESEFAGVRANLEARESELDETRAKLQSVEAELDSSRATLRATEAELETARAAVTTTLAELDTARAAARHTESSLDTTRAALSSAVSDLESSRAATAAVEATLETTRAALRAADAELAAIREEADRRVPLIDTAVDACRSMAGATTISGLFGDLTAALAPQFTRVAIFRARAHHLEGEHSHGFDSDTDVSKLVLPLTLESIITRAHSTGKAARLVPGQEGGSAPFTGTPHLALAVPIRHQDETVAVLYADADDPASGRDERPAFAEMLAAHATLLLARMSQEMKTLQELREYAAMLLQEAEQMYAADVEAGKSDADRKRRLKDTIECARQLYAQRAALEGASAAGLLDEQIAAAIGDSPSTPFARDLSHCAGGRQKAKRTAS